MNKPKTTSHLFARLTFSFFVIPLLFLAIYFSFIFWFQPIFVLIVACLINASLWEFYRITKSKGARPLEKIGISFSFLYLFSVYASLISSFFYFTPWIVLFLTLFFLFCYFFQNQDSPLLNMGATVLGLAYLTLPLSGLIIVNYFFQNKTDPQDGRWWLFYLLAVTKINDTIAYFTGKMKGKIPLAPKISPKKTVEGSLGGLTASLFTSLLFYVCMQSFYVNPPLQMRFWESIVLGFILGALAQFGDLSESLFKRDSGVKDSNDLPGLGGMLDMIDSLIFTTPFLVFFLQFTYG